MVSNVTKRVVTVKRTRYEYVLLDWDGNLAKTLDIWLEACRQLLNSQGINHVTDEQISASFGDFPEHMAAWGIRNVAAALDEVDAIAKKTLPEVELYPDAIEVLEILQQENKKLALITSSRRNNVEHLLNKHELAKFFDAVIALEDVTHYKPHPEPLEAALKSLGGNKHDAVMIGDSDKDVLAAKNAGIDSILFYPPEHKKFYNFDELNKLEPTYVVTNFRDILKIV